MIGQTLRQFRIVEQIGAGAMGLVYRAVDERNGRPAAVKVITGEAGGRGHAGGERFIREAEILQKFRHPNIVRFLGGGQYRGTLYIAMEFISGGTLEELLAQREFLPWHEVVELAIPICEALHYAHEKGVVHRDLKPSNLMISDQGQVKLTDFGIAKDLDAEALTATGRTLGTAAYMAPEQITGGAPISHKTDLYALGCVLYQMLTGRTPFSGRTTVIMMQAHLTEPAPRPSAKNPDIPKDLDNLVLGLMARPRPTAPGTRRPWPIACGPCGRRPSGASRSRWSSAPRCRRPGPPRARTPG
jgi:serine/threonine-protein kinase